MKKKIVILILTCLLIFPCVFLLTACNMFGGGKDDGSSKKPHTHSYASVWSSDETYHWKDFTCGCDKNTVDNDTFEQHNYDDNSKCSTCDYVYYSRLKYTLVDDSYYKVALAFSHYVETLSIPSEYEGLPVKEIANYGFLDCSCKRVIIPDSVEIIGVQAFSNCSALTEVTLPKSIKIIKTEAFKWCSSLKNVNFALEDGNLETIEKSAFSTCNQITKINLPKSLKTIKSSAFNNEKLTEVNYNGTVDQWSNIEFESELANPISNGASFKINNEEVKDIVVSAVNDYAFNNCDSIENVTLLEGATTIGNKAFYDCDNLSSILIPSTVSLLGEDFITSTDNLKSLKIDDNNKNYKSIDDCLYDYDLKTFYYRAPKQEKTILKVPSSVTKIENSALINSSNLTEITLPFISNTEEDEENIFLGYLFGASSYQQNKNYVPENLTKVTIERGRIIANTFFDCSSIKELNFLGSNMYKESLLGMPNLETLTIPFIEGNFGLLFGTNKYDNSYSVHQLSSNYGYKYYYIPNNLTKIIVLRGNIPNYSFTYCKSIVEMQICETAEIIDYEAFAYCRNLEKINIPESITSFGVSAFASTKFTTFKIPEKVTELPSRLFSDCENLSEITLHDNITSIGYNTFRGTAITEMHLSEKIISIGNFAFEQCYDLETLTIPFIGNSKNNKNYSYNTYTLGRMFSLSYEETNHKGIRDGEEEYYYIPSSLKNLKVLGGIINDNALLNCSHIEKLDLTGSESWEIGKDAFAGCTSLNEVKIESLDGWFRSKIGSSPLNNGAKLYVGSQLVENVTVPQDIVKIEDNIFSGCISIKSVILSDVVTEIGNYAFNNCSELNAIINTDRLKSIGDYAFYNTSIEIFTITDSIESVGAYAFENCNSLKFNEYGNLKYLGSEDNLYRILVKARNTDITECIFNINTKLISNFAFKDCNSITKIDIGNLEMWCGFDFSDIDNRNLLYRYPNAVECDLYLGGVELKEITISENNTKIGAFAFKNFKNIESVILGDDVEEIDKGAFFNCLNLKNITFNSKIQTIKENVFENCSSIEMVNIPSIELWLNLDLEKETSNPFVDAENTAKFYIKNESLTEFVVGNNFTQIKKYSFYNVNSLEKIIIPSTVKSFSKDAFKNCNIDVYLEDIESWCTNSFVNAYANPLNVSGNLYVNNELVEDLKITNAESISNYAFYGCKSIKTLVVHKHLTTIGDYAFSNCINIKIINILSEFSSSYMRYSGPTSIGKYTFSGCKNLETINAYSIIHIEAFAFEGCFQGNALYNANFGCESLSGSWSLDDPYSWDYAYVEHYYGLNYATLLSSTYVNFIWDWIN